MASRAEFPTGTVFRESHRENPPIPGQADPIDPSRTGAAPVSRAVLNLPDDVAAAVRALAAGHAVGHGFGGFYAITARGDVETVRRVNRLKGRPLDQVGSIVTTPAGISDVFDWNALPAGLSRARVLELMGAFYALGPFGFRGPAAAHVPDQLTQVAGGVRTTQLIAPGYACASNDFLARALTATGDDFLYITSANRSRHLTGDPDTPAHWRAAGLRADFGAHPGFTLLEHADEAAARAAFPKHLPMSTSILGFHALAEPTDWSGDRPCLTLERHGSMHVDDVCAVLAAQGFGLTLGPKALNRLPLREYPD
jgi:tRNA A37 threonylcarbamoyladenosine synthetase subunit TsaC/SUA5/YrdC